MSGRKPWSWCRYCGCGLYGNPVCASCRPLEAADPHAIAAKAPLTEAQLGLLLPYPEGEAGDDGTSG